MSTGRPPFHRFVSWSHAKSALLRQSVRAAAGPMLPSGRPAGRGRPAALPGASSVARALADAVRSPLPGRGVRRPPAYAGWRASELGIAAVVAAGAEVQVHPAALPLDLVVILGPAERRGSERRCCFEDSVCDVARQFLGGALPVWRAVTRSQPTTPMPRRRSPPRHVGARWWPRPCRRRQPRPGPSGSHPGTCGPSTASSA